MSDEIYREIEEDLRHQELLNFWQQNRLWIAGGVIGAVLLTGGMSWWREYSYARDMAQTAKLATAAATNDPAALETGAKDLSGSRAAIARLSEARLLASRGETEKAVAVYDVIIRDAGRGEKLWAELARLYRVNALLDTGDPARLHEDLSAMIAGKSVFRYSARELQGLLYAREGKMDKAQEALAALAADPAAPREIKGRADSLRRLYATGEK